MTKEEIQKQIDSLMKEREMVHKSIMKALVAGDRKGYSKLYAKRAELEDKINALQDGQKE